MLFLFFFKVGPPKESIFLTTFYCLYFSHQYTTLQITLWAAFQCCINTCHICIQIQTIQLLIFTEKLSPLPGFEPGTSPVPSWYATNWAILAGIFIFVRVSKMNKHQNFCEIFENCIFYHMTKMQKASAIETHWKFFITLSSVYISFIMNILKFEE